MYDALTAPTIYLRKEDKTQEQLMNHKDQI